jgi:Ca2+-binding RTX toxin-like protein
VIAPRVAFVVVVLVAVQLLPAQPAGARTLVAAGSRVARLVQAITPATLRPNPQCAAVAVTAVVRGSGTITDGANNSLLLGSPVVDNIISGRGNDCAVGGGGNDSIDGGQGTDVCIGGPGTDTFSGCETIIQ